MKVITNTIFTSFDARMMARAIKLAEKGKYSTTPNPCVGCVIVNNQQVIIGEGFHQKAGLAHAEINALAQAGDSAKGAVAYVTLEPCAHYGRTGPCALALIEAGVSKVVIACNDANPQVSNQGIKMLENAGIEVQIGLMEHVARTLNHKFFFRFKHHRPFVTVKLAASLDGKTALADGQSKWITSQQARLDVQRLRASACAILTGADTVLADNPGMNVRPHELPNDIAEKFSWRQQQPLRVIVDSKNRLSSASYQMFSDGQPSLVYNARENRHLTNLAIHHLGPSNSACVQQHQLPQIVKNNRSYIDLNALFADLANRQINHVWVEAGASLSGALFDLGLVDELILYQAPKILGASAKGLTNTCSPSLIENALSGKIVSVSQVGPDIKTTVSFSNANKL